MAASLPHKSPHNGFDAGIDNGFDANPDAASPNAASKAETARQLGDYRQRLDQLLERVESSTSHYDVLGLQPAATYDHILRAYYSALNLLYPTYALRAALAEETLERMDRVFSKVSWAFATLADFKRRADYHLLVLAKSKTAPAASKPATKAAANATLQAIKEARRVTATATPARTTTQTTPPAVAETPAAPPAAGEPEQQLRVKAQRSEKAVYSEFKAEVKDNNRRRSQRFTLALPARLVGYDRSGEKWSEMTQSSDVSRTGVTLTMRRRVRNGMVLYLTIPLPVKLRSHSFGDSSFNTYVLVRRVEPAKKGIRVVALEFIGEHPPTGYLEKPWALFKPHQWTGSERRRSQRQNRIEKIHIEYFNDALESLGREETITENISKQGMRLRVARAPFEFDLVRVSCPSLRFESLAVVRNRYVNKDQIERLCIQFVPNSQRSVMN